MVLQTKATELQKAQSVATELQKDLTQVTQELLTARLAVDQVLFDFVLHPIPSHPIPSHPIPPIPSLNDWFDFMINRPTLSWRSRKKWRWRRLSIKACWCRFMVWSPPLCLWVLWWWRCRMCRQVWRFFPWLKMFESASEFRVILKGFLFLFHCVHFCWSFQRIFFGFILIVPKFSKDFLLLHFDCVYFCWSFQRIFFCFILIVPKFPKDFCSASFWLCLFLLEFPKDFCSASFWLCLFLLEFPKDFVLLHCHCDDFDWTCRRNRKPLKPSKYLPKKWASFSVPVGFELKCQFSKDFLCWFWAEVWFSTKKM